MPAKTRKSFRSLYFVLDQARDGNDLTPGSIPKTAVFDDNQTEILLVIQQLRQWLVDPCYMMDQAKKTVRPYFHTTPEREKHEICSEFSKKDSVVRILVCSESLGIGVNIDDIARVPEPIECMCVRRADSQPARLLFRLVPFR